MRIAAWLRVPPIIIGLTVVAVGTSMPELAVGVEAALRGNGSFSVANIAGTNVVNLMLILGLSAAIRPLAMDMRTLRFDLPVMTVAAGLLLVMCFDGTLSRAEGVLLVLLGLAYTASIVVLARRESQAAKEEFAREYSPQGILHQRHSWLDHTLSAAGLLLGIVVIVFGSDWLVDGAVGLARAANVPDSLIALTIVAIGTSAPELVTTIIGTVRNDRDIAIGNLLGSSTYNIVAILGITAAVPEQGLDVDRQLRFVDLPLMMLATLICVPVFLSGRRVTRIEGGLLVAGYAAYLTYLITART